MAIDFSKCENGTINGVDLITRFECLSGNSLNTSSGKNLVRQWLVIGVAEVLLSLILIAVAPRYLNSDKPQVGFLMWASVPVLMGSSLLYVTRRLNDAQKSRRLFISRFPEYSALTLADFLTIPSAQVVESLETLELLQSDPDFQMLSISPLDFLRGANK